MKNVLIPGFAVKAFLFDNLTNFKKKFIIIEQKDYTYGETSTILKRLVEENGRINLSGWSLGTLYALKWTLENPNYIEKLFLTGATSLFVEKGDYKNGIKPSVVERMIRLVKAGKKKLVLNDFYNNVFDFLRDKQEIIKKLLDSDIDEEYLVNGLKSLLEIDLRDKIKNIDKKTLIIQGEKDTITPLYGAEYIKNNIISSKLIKKPLGHSILLENTEETVKEYEDFINER